MTAKEHELAIKEASILESLRARPDNVDQLEELCKVQLESGSFSAVAANALLYPVAFQQEPKLILQLIKALRGNSEHTKIPNLVDLILGKTDDKGALILIEVANLCFELGFFGRFLSALQKLGANSEYPSKLAANLYYEQRKYKELLVHSNKALQNSPSDLDQFRYCVLGLFACKQLTEGRKQLNRLLTFATTNQLLTSFDLKLAALGAPDSVTLNSLTSAWRKDNCETIIHHEAQHLTPNDDSSYFCCLIYASAFHADQVNMVLSHLKQQLGSQKLRVFFYTEEEREVDELAQSQKTDIEHQKLCSFSDLEFEASIRENRPQVIFDFVGHDLHSKQIPLHKLESEIVVCNATMSATMAPLFSARPSIRHTSVSTDIANVIAICREKRKEQLSGRDRAQSILDVAPREQAKTSVSLLSHLGRTGGTLISKCLACMDDVLMLSEVHPTCSAKDPLEQAHEYFKLLRDEEFKALKEYRCLSYSDKLRLISQRAAAANKSLLVRDWSHVDFLTLPFNTRPTGKLSNLAVLKESYNVNHVATVRHPFDSFVSLNKLVVINHTELLSPFLQGTLAFAKEAYKVGFVRYEDFCKSPDQTLRNLTKALGLNYDENYKERYKNYKFMTGDTVNAKQREEIKPFQRKNIHHDLLKAMRSFDQYWEILELLNYSDVD